MNYKFRGLTEEGKWVYGSLLKDEKGNFYIGELIKSKSTYSVNMDNRRRTNKTRDRFLAIGFIMVIPESVGQFTGLHDKNKKPIYDGDIVEEYFTNGKLWKKRYIGFKSGSFIGTNIPLQKEQVNNSFSIYTNEFRGMESDWVIIGNVHQNPELMNP